MGTFRISENKTLGARGCGNNLPLFLGKSLPQVNVIQECSCQVKQCPMQPQVPGTEPTSGCQEMWLRICCAATPGSAAGAVLCPERALSNAGLSLLWKE